MQIQVKNYKSGAQRPKIKKCVLRSASVCVCVCVTAKEHACNVTKPSTAFTKAIVTAARALMAIARLGKAATTIIMVSSGHSAETA